MIFEISLGDMQFKAGCREIRLSYHIFHSRATTLWKSIDRLWCLIITVGLIYFRNYNDWTIQNSCCCCDSVDATGFIPKGNTVKIKHLFNRVTNALKEIGLEKMSN